MCTPKAFLLPINHPQHDITTGQAGHALTCPSHAHSAGNTRHKAALLEHWAPAVATDGTPHTQSLLRPRYGLTCTLKPLLRATLSPHMLHTKPTQLEHAGMPHSANAAA